MDNYKKLSILHFADLHLDMPFSSLGGRDGAGQARRRDLKNAFGRIIRTAKNEQSELILVAGDLYEHGYADRSAVTFINEGFKELACAEIVILPGNHDPAAANSYYRTFQWNRNVHILTKEKPYVILDRLCASVYGLGFSNINQEIGAIARLKENTPRYFNILMFHGSPGMGFAADSYNPIGTDELDSMGMDYVALGHFHNVLKGLGKTGGIFNPGSPEALGFDEPGEHGIFAGVLERAGFPEKACKDIRFIPIGSKFYESLEIDITGCSTDEQVISRMNSAFGNRSLENGLFNITLKGAPGSGHNIDTDYIRASLAGRMFYVNIKAAENSEYDLEAISREPGLRGLFVRKLLLLMDKEQDAERRELYRKAARYGLEALEKGRVTV